VTSVLALFNGRFHITLHVSPIIREPGLAVEEIIPYREEDSDILSWPGN